MHLNRMVMLRTVARRGVQPQEGFALTYLSQNDGISQRELAEALHLSHPRVSAIMGSLEQQGLIARRVDETDRRLVRIVLTPEGRRSEKEQRAVLGDYVERTIGALAEPDRMELDRLLGELAERIVELLRDVQTAGSDEGGEKPR
jgi:DNA-binding MarR family transcriptional regulator